MERITRKQILARLADRVIVMDGAMGTLLMQQVGSCNLPEQQFQFIASSPCSLNLTECERVAQVHRAYIRAGAELIETNTFNLQASLSPNGSLDNLYEMSRRGAEIARKVAEEEGLGFMLNNERLGEGVSCRSLGEKCRGWRKEWGPRRAIVAGCIAATSDSIAEYEMMAEGLLDGGADVLLVESIYNLSYAEAALRWIQTVLKRKFSVATRRGARERIVVAAKEESIENKVLAQNRVDLLEEESVASVPEKESIVSVPIMASATIDREGRILSGEDIRTLFSRLGRLGLSGADGKSGLSGAEGWSAFSDANGKLGLSGADGKSGLSGAEGKSGLSGSDGNLGLSDDEGKLGLSGAEGKLELFSVGLNCSEGAEAMIPYADELAAIAAANVGEGGTAGATGASGAVANSSGEVGDRGNASASGVDGAGGSMGTVGAAGATGASGALANSSGEVGDCGNAGATGVDGAGGSMGTVSAAGVVGVEGRAGRLAVSICPSAGLPDADGRYPEPPEFWASCVCRMIAGADSTASGISGKHPASETPGKHPAYFFVGGCCGTTPDHIKSLCATLKTTIQR